MFHVYSAGLVTDFPVKETSYTRGFVNENFPAVRLSPSIQATTLTASEWSEFLNGPIYF
jgi:hypothetical protein